MLYSYGCNCRGTTIVIARAQLRHYDRNSQGTAIAVAKALRRQGITCSIAVALFTHLDFMISLEQKLRF